MNAKQRAEERLKNKTDELDEKRAKLALARAMSRLKLKKKCNLYKAYRKLYAFFL